MNEKAIRAKIADVTKTFDDLQASREQKQTELSNIDTELTRLQGEYRALNGLLPEEADPAKVIEAKPADIQKEAKHGGK